VDDTLKRGQAELHHLVGDAGKARQTLGWQPSIGFEDLVRLLVDSATARLTGS
jgi:GDPmannose 4,6-dehydratase